MEFDLEQFAAHLDRLPRRMGTAATMREDNLCRETARLITAGVVHDTRWKSLLAPEPLFAPEPRGKSLLNKNNLKALRARQKVGANWHLIRGRVLKRDAKSCQICYAGDHLTVHHVRPRNRGGMDGMKNLVTLCERCHDFIELHELFTWRAVLDVRDLWREKRDLSEVLEIITESNHRQASIST
jgi:HNH endonuclease